MKFLSNITLKILNYLQNKMEKNTDCKTCTLQW